MVEIEPSPDAIETTTVPPVATRRLPCASFKVTVIVEVVLPFATIEVVDADTTEVAVEAAPGVRVII